MEKCFIVRHSAVLPSDYSNPKEWREVVFFRWAKEYAKETKMLVSGFDHYALKPRKDVSFVGSEDVMVFSTPGYRKTVSLLRVLDAWIFGIKVLAFAFKEIGKDDVVVVSLPTPESAFCLSIGKMLFRYTLIVDVRDNWPDNYPGRGVLKKAFSLYVHCLNLLTFKSVDKFIWMSDGLYDHHDRKGLIKTRGKDHFTIPVSPPAVTIDEDEISDFDYLFSRPSLAFFGTLNPQFDLGVLKLLIEKSPSSNDFNFIIAGSGDQLKSLKSLFSNCGNVFFLGHVSFEVTQLISKKCSGFFLLYRDPETYENHITNKFREYAEYKKPIFHNLESSRFTVSNKKYKIGCSSKEVSLESFLSELKFSPNSMIFGIGSLDELCLDLSPDALKEKFIRILES